MMMIHCISGSSWHRAGFWADVVVNAGGNVSRRC